jgi:hypothetical protein
MKKTTRLSIEIRHREVTITFEGSKLNARDDQPSAANPTTVCPTCNSPWTNLIAPTDGDSWCDRDRIYRVLLKIGLHAQIFPAGQLRICQRSLELLKERF